MRLSLRVLGLDMIVLEVSTEDEAEPRDTEVGIAATVNADPPPERLGFEEQAR